MAATSEEVVEHCEFRVYLIVRFNHAMTSGSENCDPYYASIAVDSGYQLQAVLAGTVFGWTPAQAPPMPIKCRCAPWCRLRSLLSAR